MFTGIVQGKAKITHISGSDKLKTFTVSFPEKVLANVKKGASIALNGTCLTVTSFDIDKSIADFDVMHETLKLTNLGQLNIDDLVNFERAASIGDEIGGHLMSGHISAKVKVIDLKDEDQEYTITFETEQELGKYILPKGFVGLNGCSLTIGETKENTFNVHLIPETLAVTTFGQLRVGELVNLEIDPQTQAIVDTVEKVLALKKPA